LETYSSYATVNPLVYWFDANRPIFCTPVIWNDLQAVGGDAVEFAARAQTCDDANALRRSVRTAKNIINVQRLLDGKPSASTAPGR
jgi:hypothetical protein